MRHLHIVLGIILYSVSFLTYSQTVFRGKVVDAISGEPIAYAKIGVENQGVGIISNSDGFFSYKKYHESLGSADMMIVGAPGYHQLELNNENIQSLLNQSFTIKLDPKVNTDDSKAQKKLNKLRIFWDVSEGLIDRKLSKELAFLQQFLDIKKPSEISLDIFANTLLQSVDIGAWDGDIEKINKLVNSLDYDGPSNYSNLRLAENEMGLLMSNGLPNYGRFKVSQDVPIFSYTTSIDRGGQEFLDLLGEYTSGENLSFASSIVQANLRLVKSDEPDLKKINGQITSFGIPVQKADILIRGKMDEYTSTADGKFEVPASVGDILVIKALGMFPKAILIENNEYLNIDLLPSNEQLDEVVITSKKENIVVGNKIIEGVNEPFMPGGITRLGDFYITDKDITPNARTIGSVIRDNFTGINLIYTPQGEMLTVFGKRPMWIVNGFKVDKGEPLPMYIMDSEIVSIIVKDSQGLDLKYGGPGEKGLQILVTTRSVKDNGAVRNRLLVTNNKYEENVPSIQGKVFKNERQVKGIITSSEKPIKDAEILIKGTFSNVYTNRKGAFKIKAKSLDTLIVSALGMFSKQVVIDKNDIYEVDLVPKNNELDEVMLTGEGADYEENRLQIKKDALAKKSGFSSNIILKEEFEGRGYIRVANIIAQKTPSTKLVGQYPNIRIANTRAQELYGVVVDGVPRDQDVFDILDPNIIQSIQVIPSPSGGLRYGLSGLGGVIIIETDQSISNNQSSGEPASMLVTGNDYTEEISESETSSMLISGSISKSGGPLSGATISEKGSFKQVETDALGNFEINSREGAVLILSAPGFFSKEVLVEKNNLGNIELLAKNDTLKEIILGGSERKDNTVVETAYGQTDENSVGYSSDKIESSLGTSSATTLRDLIIGKFSGVTIQGGLTTGSKTKYKIRGGYQSLSLEIDPLWLVNGIPYDEPPTFLDVQLIESITVLKSLAATSRYGSLAAAGAFIIKTKEGDFEDKAAQNNQSALVTGNEYAGDVTGDIDAVLPAYIVRFRESGNPQQQFALYKKLSRTQESPLEYYVDAAQYFQSIDPKLGDKVRSDLAYIARNNTKALRTLSYLYELVNDTKNIVLVNERIAKISPQEAQSYRDLALAYQNHMEYDKALELYINMLGEQIKGVNFEGLEKPIKSELSRLLALYKDKVDYSRLPNEWLRTDFKRDVRMVIDWSDRSVPFEFQFVNPDKKFFKWTHNLEETRERLEAEQKQGFQTEEFIIDDAPSGEWLINIQYLGSEGDYVLPPFLKYTVYRDYGTPKETKEVRVIKLFKQVDKVTLGRVSI